MTVCCAGVTLSCGFSTRCEPEMRSRSSLVCGAGFVRSSSHFGFQVGRAEEILMAAACKGSPHHLSAAVVFLSPGWSSCSVDLGFCFFFFCFSHCDFAAQAG